jgi:hypothetical protein
LGGSISLPSSPIKNGRRGPTQSRHRKDSYGLQAVESKEHVKKARYIQQMSRLWESIEGPEAA